MLKPLQSPNSVHNALAYQSHAASNLPHPADGKAHRHGWERCAALPAGWAKKLEPLWLDDLILTPCPSLTNHPPLLPPSKQQTVSFLKHRLSYILPDCFQDQVQTPVHLRRTSQKVHLWLHFWTLFFRHPSSYSTISHMQHVVFWSSSSHVSKLY